MILQDVLTIILSDLLDHSGRHGAFASVRPLAGYRRLRLSFFRG